MERLIDYITEASGSFNKYVSNIDDLFDIPYLFNDKLKDDLKPLLERILEETGNGYGIERLFIYSDIKKYFKIPYIFRDVISNVIKEFKQFTLIDYGGNKIIVKYPKYGEVFETGSGSIGRVSTYSQESATVKVWNKFSSSSNDKGNIQLDLDDIKVVNNLVSDICADFDTGWITTFIKQIKSIKDYIETVLGGNIEDYRLIRYGDDKVGTAYGKFIQKYTDIISNKMGQKDNYDPSDVILYKVDEQNYIINELNKLHNSITVENVREIKEKFFERLFEKNLLQGISLKKISGSNTGMYEIFNSGGNEKISNISDFEIGKDTSKNQVKVVCKGSFTLGNMTDENGEVINTIDEIILTLRSFGNVNGGKRVALDAAYKKSPSLGKCPKRIWMDELNIEKDDSKNLNKCVEIFKDYLNNTDENYIKRGLKRLIQACIKDGGDCFPFILLH